MKVWTERNSFYGGARTLTATWRYGQRRKSLWQNMESRTQTTCGKTNASKVNAKSFLSSSGLLPNVKLLRYGWIKDGLGRHLVPGGGRRQAQMLIIWWWMNTLVNAWNEDYENWCLDWRLRDCHPFLVGIHGLLIPIMMKLLNTGFDPMNAGHCFLYCVNVHATDLRIHGLPIATLMKLSKASMWQQFADAAPTYSDSCVKLWTTARAWGNNKYAFE